MREGWLLTPKYTGTCMPVPVLNPEYTGTMMPVPVLTPAYDGTRRNLRPHTVHRPGTCLLYTSPSPRDRG
eukprot:3290338-Rhodomonas_salina.1